MSWFLLDPWLKSRATLEEFREAVHFLINFSHFSGNNLTYSIISADQKPDNIFDSEEFKDREMSARISHHGIFDFIWISKKSPPSKSGNKTKITSVLRFPGKPVKVTGPGPGAEDSRSHGYGLSWPGHNRVVAHLSTWDIPLATHNGSTPEMNAC
jgi:hypothetical protein